MYNTTPFTHNSSGPSHAFPLDMSFISESIDPESNTRGYIAIALSATFTSLAFVILLLRLYTRIYIVRNAGWDDVLAGVAWVQFHPIEQPFLNKVFLPGNFL